MSDMSVYSLIILCTQQLKTIFFCCTTNYCIISFVYSSGTLIFFRKVSLHALVFILTFFSFFDIIFCLFFSHLQWILLKSVFFITDLLSWGVKPFLSWLRCELKFYHYIFLTLDVFFSLSYFPLQLSICLTQSFVLCHFSQCSCHLTFYLLVTICMVFLNFLWEQPMLSFQKLSL